MITSLSNQHIKEIKHLKDRKYRNEVGLTFIEGIRIVYEAIQQNIEISEILISPELLKSKLINEIVTKAKIKSIQITELSKEVFESISNKDGPQGLAAIVHQQWFTLEEIQRSPGTWVGLFEIADPGNLGTILRTCDGVGATGVVLIGNCTDPYDPTAIRASMGAVFSKRIIKTSVDEFIKWAQKNLPLIVGTSDKSPTDYREVVYDHKLILLMGSERQGISEALQKICNKIVSIPMAGSCDSLNLAVATSILLYEIYRKDSKKENK